MSLIELESFSKDVGDGTISLIVDVDAGGEYAPNAVLQLKMEWDSGDGEPVTIGPIWLKKTEFLKLGMLLILLSQYFEETFPAGQEATAAKMEQLKERWGIASRMMDRMLGES